MSEPKVTQDVIDDAYAAGLLTGESYIIPMGFGAWKESLAKFAQLQRSRSQATEAVEINENYVKSLEDFTKQVARQSGNVYFKQLALQALSKSAAPPVSTQPPQGDANVLIEALERSMVAIDDWLNIYAEEHCDEQRVKEAKARTNEHGTLAYIADVQHSNRAAVATYRAGKGE